MCKVIKTGATKEINHTENNCDPNHRFLFFVKHLSNLTYDFSQLMALMHPLAILQAGCEALHRIAAFLILLSVMTKHNRLWLESAL